MIKSKAENKKEKRERIGETEEKLIKSGTDTAGRKDNEEETKK
jgi:hypothetical protein